LNKQYSQDEYEKIVPLIIEGMTKKPHPSPLLAGEGDLSPHPSGTPLGKEGVQNRGEFFDPSLSPFAYNETTAQDLFPLSKEEALQAGFQREDNNYDPVIPQGVETIQ